MESVRDLEDLIMESIFLGTLAGKMNQKEKCFEVNNVMARDVMPNRYSFLIEALSKWDNACQDVVKSIDKRAVELKESKQRSKHLKDEFLEKISYIKSTKSDTLEKPGGRKRTIHEDLDFGP
ncbi:COP9 signalosome complex subunit 7b [Entomophthora muscae]|uniref:COP9 signalosome complex subunit 7b n=1 Tax=Entomophthora muscae TaxID=34485 RepID=A0ACC2UUH2_9FUNG|nr:COP9 signalosome complex subunit 7b [Entomophthora muscae]